MKNVSCKIKDRFLLEMATRTGKTLTSATVIRLVLRTKNARRVLFLVDRLELEDQALKAFTNYLKPDYTIYYPPGEDVNIRALKYFFKAYIVDNEIRKIIEAKDFHALQTNPTLTISQFKAVSAKCRDVLPMYIKDYVSLDKFVA
jgi:type I restriction enzyme R subunit